MKRRTDKNVRQRMDGQECLPHHGSFLLAAGLGLIGCITGSMIAPHAFYFSYLTGYIFTLTLVLGMLFFVMLHHVTDAGWSVVVRRAAEQCLAALPVLVLLFLPVVVGMGQLYHWLHPATDEAKHLVEAKWPWLTVWSFLLRAAIYFAAWLLLGAIFRGKSLRQDLSGDPQLSLSMRRWSAPGFLIYALTFTFASIDWIMALDFEWFSTIFGVYVWSGSAVSSLALLTLMILALARGGLRGRVHSDHLHDLGKLVFAFAVFWAYIAFSQYFLIWYANIPEETGWFLARWRGSWKWISVLLPVIQFVVPFLAIMSAVMKRRPRVLAAMCMLLLVAHYVDVYWLVMPSAHAEGVAWKYLWIDASAVLLTAGACGAIVVLALSKSAVYPVKDPRLDESLMIGHGPHAAEAGHG